MSSVSVSCPANTWTQITTTSKSGKLLVRKSSGSVSLQAPTDTVNNGNTVSGLSFYWQLNEV